MYFFFYLFICLKGKVKNKKQTNKENPKTNIPSPVTTGLSHSLLVFLPFVLGQLSLSPMDVPCMFYKLTFILDTLACWT